VGRAPQKWQNALRALAPAQDPATLVAQRIHDSSGERPVMHARRNSVLIAILCATLFTIPSASSAAPRKTHTVVLGAARKVPYSRAGDPSGAMFNEDTLQIRALLVDGVLKEWTTDDAHDVTDRSFVVRRALRLNDVLPTDNPGQKPAGPPGHWVWQRGPWLLVDRATGHITALHLPDYDPGVSLVSWFRDYAAYCGLTASGKSLYGVVAQLAVRKPVLARKISEYEPNDGSTPICGFPDWQREPLRITFHPNGKDDVSYDVVPGSAVLVEDTGDVEETPEPAPQK
jgi:hypothetical protein